jgi:hypothetical protein
MQYKCPKCGAILYEFAYKGLGETIYRYCAKCGTKTNSEIKRYYFLKWQFEFIFVVGFMSVVLFHVFRGDSLNLVLRFMLVRDLPFFLLGYWLIYKILNKCPKCWYYVKSHHTFCHNCGCDLEEKRQFKQDYWDLILILLVVLYIALYWIL